MHYKENNSSAGDSENNEIERKILETVEVASRPLSKSEIAHHIQSTPATVAKYVDILVAKKKLTIAKYGNIHLVSRGEANAKK